MNKNQLLKRLNPKPKKIDQTADVVIIGGGPAGLYTSYQLGLLGLSAIILESTDRLGGKLLYEYPNQTIDDLPGLGRVRADDFAEQLCLQALKSNPLIYFNTKVIDVDFTDSGCVVYDSDNNKYFGTTVVDATGHGAFTPKYPPYIKNIDKAISEQFLNFYLQEEYDSGKIVIFGTSNYAVQTAIEIANLRTTEVVVVNSNNIFKAEEYLVETLERLPNVKIYMNHSPYSFNVEDKEVSILDTHNNMHVTLSCDVVHFFYGLKQYDPLYFGSVTAVPYAKKTSRIIAVGDRANDLEEQEDKNFLSTCFYHGMLAAKICHYRANGSYPRARYTANLL